MFRERLIAFSMTRPSLERTAIAIVVAASSAILLTHGPVAFLMNLQHLHEHIHLENNILFPRALAM